MPPVQLPPRILRFTHHIQAIKFRLVQWCRRWGCRGCKRTRKSFDLLKFPAKSFKNVGKIPENLCRNGANIVWRQEMAPNVCWKVNEGHFWRSYQTNGQQKLHDYFLDTFVKMWAKILSTPENMLVPTPVVWYRGARRNFLGGGWNFEKNIALWHPGLVYRVAAR